MELILAFTTSLLLSVALTPLLMRYASRLRLVDFPTTERHIHADATPRVGGLSIVFGAFVGVAYWYPPNSQLWALFAGGGIIALFGLLDDLYGLSYRSKFFGQILAVVITMAGGVVISVVPGFGMDPAPLWVSYPLTFLFLLGVVNAVNLADGLDGLAGGTVLLSLGLILVLALQAELRALSLVTLGVMGAVIGFLRYNTHPAQVFMGDTGSQFLGYMTACLAILVTQSEYTALNPALPLFIIGLPILDTLLVICIRLVRGRSPFAADTSHIHHQLLCVGFRHYEAVAVLYVIQALFVLLAWYYRYAADLTIVAVYCAYCATFVGLVGLVRTLGWRVRQRSEHYVGAERRNRLLRRFYVVHRRGPNIVEGFLSLLITAAGIAYAGVRPDRETLLAGLALVVILPLLYRLPYVWITRLLSYTASILVASAMVWYSDTAPEIDRVLDVSLAILALFLVLSIRVTRKAQFRLDTQDLLVLFLVLVLPLLPFENIDRYQLGHVAIRLAILFYACEYVVSAARGKQFLLKAGSVLTLGVFGLAVY